MSGRGGEIGSIVGYITKQGRRAVKFNGQLYFEYCLIWMYYYGEDIPNELEVDHIDNNPDNNRIDNLRLVSHQENQLNRGDSKDNGCLWKDNPIRIERNRISSRQYYHNLSPEEKKEYNRRCKERRQAKKNKRPKGD